MNKNCTSLEQSKKLIELGIDVNTAVMYWLNRHIDLTETKYQSFVVDRSNEHIDFFNSYPVAVEKGEIIPAWSLSALLELMPEHFALDYIEEKWMAYNTNYGINAIEASFPIDAVFEMIVWLKENSKI